ncbi:hypothetical protein AFCA_004067 [Aspergillus flavus]|uniref:Uncharacterized protein n=1 Tax=Aspergillus flavus TaxID=5059 RepID=A0AB74C3W8_ASPFL|nr:hypothetical protein CA14_000679 [Aspergillus flavus]UDD56534.1 hypothetical protein AFCA_004067 [Aspergillus flavus]
MSTPELEPVPQGSPQVRNLEIRGTWDGEVNGRAELRISLEVQSTPNTQIQILDTRSPTVLLCKASIQFLSEKWGQNSQPSEVAPQSPLFEFFEPIYPDGEGACMNFEGFPETPDPSTTIPWVKLIAKRALQLAYCTQIMKLTAP